MQPKDKVVGYSMSEDGSVRAVTRSPKPTSYARILRRNEDDTFGLEIRNNVLDGHDPDKDLLIVSGRATGPRHGILDLNRLPDDQIFDLIRVGGSVLCRRHAERLTARA